MTCQTKFDQIIMTIIPEKLLDNDCAEFDSIVDDIILEIYDLPDGIDRIVMTTR